MIGDSALFYRIHVFVCTNRRPDDHPLGSCAAGGADELRNYLKQRARKLGLKGIRVNSAGCLDRCEFGPALVIYPEGVWYTYRTTEDLEEILQVHMIDGGRVDRLLLQPEDGPARSRQD